MRYNFDSVKMFIKKHQKKNRKIQVADDQEEEQFDDKSSDVDEGLEKVVFDPKIELASVA